jgi:hypothetical protein
MVGIFAQARRPKSRRPSARHSRIHFVERLEERAYLAAVSITGPTEVNEVAKTAQFVVSLSQKVAAPVTVSYSLQSTPATATFGRDYRLFLGRSQVRPTGTLTFRPGQTRQVIRMNIINDNLREGDERFAFTLQAARNATLDPQARSLGVTIKDNDAYTVSIVGPATVPDGTMIEYQLQLSSPATRRETFYVSTRDGTGRVTQDYRPLTRVPVTILPGKSSAMLRVVTVANSVPDYDRIFFLDVVPASPGFPAPSPFQITIPGELGPLPPSVSIADVTVTEGNAGTSTTANFLVSLNFASTVPVSVNYATSDGTATVANNDYLATAGTLVFSPGETSKLVSVTVIGDDDSEPNETFQVVLTNSPDIVIERGTATGTIVNDDASGFNIDLVYLTPMQPSWTAVVEEAAARWEQVITGDLPDVVYQGRTIDDFEIDVRFESLGPNLLGYARTLARRPGNAGLPYRGEMVMNSLYANLAGLFDTVAHELAHALGFSPTQWAAMNLTGGTLANPLFVGVNATREFNAAFGRSDAGVPLYDEGTPGDGSYGAHWRDSLFGYEMMVSAGPADRRGAPLSRITVGHFEDIGYQVNYGAADPYTPNPRQAAIDFRRLQLSGATRTTRRMVADPVGMARANLFAGAAFSTGTLPAAQSHSVTTRTFRSVGGGLRT